MAWQVKVLVAKPNELSSTHRDPLGRRRQQTYTSCPLTPPQVHALVHTHTK